MKRKCPLLKENYTKLQAIWEERESDMKTLMDLLEFYNNTDVAPFCKAVRKMQKFYKKLNICLLKDDISVPGIARTLLFRSAEANNFSFPLMNKKNADLFHTIQSNLIGGASIIFHRYHEKGKTFIRGNKEKPCGQILGLDANALYLYCLAQDMPVGYFTRRKRENGFRPERNEEYIAQFMWMDWYAQEYNVSVGHAMNTKIKRKFGRYYPDGLY